MGRDSCHAASAPSVRPPDTYAALRARLKLVIVDEGHYEPAQKWSMAVRELGCSTVLFTATPYRNDLKYFDVDHRHVLQFTHRDAQDQCYLRTPVFAPLTFDSVSTFCDGVTSFVAAHREDGDRILIRCESAADVRNVTTYLRQQGQRAVGIHETFVRDRADGLHKAVPQRTTDADYWVHQFKLTEGHDDPRFRFLAFHAPFRAARALIQQVGRVLRNPGRTEGAEAFVLHDPATKLEELWERYRVYDDTTAGAGLPPAPRDFLPQLPEMQYIAGTFREPFEITAPALHEQLLFPKSVRIHRLPPGLDLDKISDAVVDQLQDLDFEVGVRQQPADGVVLHPYISVRNSPLLIDTAFFEYTLGYTLYRKIADLLFYVDTQGIAPELVRKLPQIPQSELTRLLPDTGETRLTDVALANTDIGAHSIRTRKLGADSLAAIATELSDVTHMATTVRGRATLPGAYVSRSRYLGLSRGRVREDGYVRFDELMDWFELVHGSVTNGAIRPSHVFHRYAEPVPPPTDPEPEHILFTFEQQRFVSDNGPLRIVDIQHVGGDNFDCSVLHDDGSTTVYTISVRWSDADRRYNLGGAELNSTYRLPDPGPGVPGGVLDYLAHEQAFRIIPISPNGADYCVYVDGAFYRPRLPLGRTAPKQLELLSLMETDSRLARIGSEKGPEGSATPPGWAAGSLFNLIDTAHSHPRQPFGKALGRFDMLVCDDLSTEMADFIAVRTVTSDRQVAFVHAKASRDPRPLSASVLQEVTAQAVKNLSWLHPHNLTEPPNTRRWDNQWNGGKIGKVHQRIRRGTSTTGAAFWKEVRESLRDPAAQREVWIVLGQSLSLGALQNQCRATRPSAETIQILYILQATWASVAQTGGRLRVFCSP